MADEDRREGGLVPKTYKANIQSSSIQHSKPERLAPHVKLGPFGEVVSSESAEVKALTSAKAKKSPSKADAARQIGRQLQTVYNDVLSQPVPQRLLDVLRELDVSVSKAKETK